VKLNRFDGQRSDVAMTPRVCANCVLPETFPRIRFDEHGTCNFCLDSQDKGGREKKAADYREKFNSLVSDYKGKSVYDALMCYSGGKDSTYTLAVLKETYGLNVLAVTLDNGFVSNQASQNIHNVVEMLDIDHIFFKPSFHVLAKIFRTCATRDIFPPKTLERASTICTSCMAILKSSALRLALEKDIPFIAFGWSPGQAPITSSIMRNNPDMVRMMQKTLFDPLYRIAGDDIRPYFLEEKHFSGDYRFPTTSTRWLFWTIVKTISIETSRASDGRRPRMSMPIQQTAFSIPLPTLSMLIDLASIRMPLNWPAWSGKDTLIVPVLLTS
jgi:hypothetical protein